jgi:hypothetical protein
MMTEDEAREKRCCGGAGIGRYVLCGTEGRWLCIASDCMAWRWAQGSFEYCIMDNRIVDEKMSAERGHRWLTHTDEPPPPPADKGWKAEDEPYQKRNYAPGCLEQRWSRPRANRRGYCGLAGEPK